MKKLLFHVLHWKVGQRSVPLMLFLLLCSNIIIAQTKVEGVVSDGNGLTLPGVTVSVVGGQNVVTTDLDGQYSIDAPSNGTLSFSYIGFISQNLTIGGKTKLNVVMKENVEDLNEVVVIGYGTQKKGDINGAV
ncbi:MAG: SusC/RagA family protein, partial [Flavobacterium sp.]